MSAVKELETDYPMPMMYVEQATYGFLSQMNSSKDVELRLIIAVALSLLIHFVLFFNYQEYPLNLHVLPAAPTRIALRFSSLQTLKANASEKKKNLTKTVVAVSKKPAHVLKKKIATHRQSNKQNKETRSKQRQTVPITTDTTLSPVKKKQAGNDRIVSRQTTYNKIKPKYETDFQSASSATQIPPKSKIIMNPRFRYPPIPPVYPHQSIRRNQEGTTLIRARISRYGKIEELKVHQSSGYARLDQAALAAVKKWKFEPARQNGLAVSSWVQVPVNFVLEKR